MLSISGLGAILALQTGGGSRTGRQKEKEETDDMLKGPCSLYSTSNPQKSKERHGAGIRQSLLLGALSSTITYGDPSVARTGLRSKKKQKTIKFSASCAAVLTSSHVCPERVNSESSSTASGQHTALDVICTLACRNPLWEN